MPARPEDRVGGERDQQGVEARPAAEALRAPHRRSSPGRAAPRSSPPRSRRSEPRPVIGRQPGEHRQVAPEPRGRRRRPSGEDRWGPVPHAPSATGARAGALRSWGPSGLLGAQDLPELSEHLLLALADPGGPEPQEAALLGRVGGSWAASTSHSRKPGPRRGRPSRRRSGRWAGRPWISLARAVLLLQVEVVHRVVARLRLLADTLATATRRSSRSAAASAASWRRSLLEDLDRSTRVGEGDRQARDERGAPQRAHSSSVYAALSVIRTSFASGLGEVAPSLTCGNGARRACGTVKPSEKPRVPGAGLEVDPVSGPGRHCPGVRKRSPNSFSERRWR